AIVDKVNAAAVSLLTGVELRQAFAERGIIAAGDSPEQFGQFIRAEVAKWRALAERVGIVPE
ncbi:MAG: tripartite tricarboxylate transporter substrate binding protein, partial [Rhizobacter sp.]|nr:tripartite tricarboxylate transporter substrate binding protein [Rhizobacter sp.]